MTSCRTFLFALLLMLGFLVPAEAKEPPARETLDQLAAAEARYVASLEAQAKEAGKRLAYALRDEIYEHLLQFRPDHADARRWLKYKRNKENTDWIRKGRYRRPRNMRSKPAAELLATYEAAWQALLEKDVRAALAGVQRADACPAVERQLDTLRDIERHRLGVRSGDGAPLAADAEQPAAMIVPVLRKELRLRRYSLARKAGNAVAYRAARHLLKASYPEDEAVHKHLGEVQGPKGGWQLPETAKGLERRAAWIALRDDLAKRTPPEASPLDADEIGASMPGMLAVTTENIRVAGTGTLERLQGIAHAMETSADVFKALLGRTALRRKGMTAFAFALPEEIDTFLERYPKSRPELLAARRQHQLDITWMDGRRMVVRNVPADAQIDLCLGLLHRMLVVDTYKWPGLVPGWVDEGLCRYLTFRTSGTRLSVAVDGRYQQKGGPGREVPGSQDKWLASARVYAKAMKEPDLRLLFGKKVDAFSTQDAVLSYAFCCYLIECFPGSMDQLIPLLIKKTEIDRALRASTGMPLGVFLVHWQQWLNETTLE